MWMEGVGPIFYLESLYEAKEKTFKTGFYWLGFTGWGGVMTGESLGGRHWLRAPHYLVSESLSKGR